MEIVRIYFLLFIIYSIMGWFMEVLFALFTNKKFSNRGFLIGPYCPIYGIGAVLVLIFLSKFQNDIVILFILSIILCSLLEYFTSYFMEKVFNARWWDYSDNKFNINGRICLETMIPFGLISCFVVSFLNPLIVGNLHKLSDTVLDIIAIICFIIFLVDVILSFNIVNNFKTTVKNSALLTVDRTDDFNKYVKKMLLEKSFFHRRLIKAFPKIVAIPKIHEKIKKKIKKTKTS